MCPAQIIQRCPHANREPATRIVRENGVGMRPMKLRDVVGKLAAHSARPVVIRQCIDRDVRRFMPRRDGKGFGKVIGEATLKPFEYRFLFDKFKWIAIM